MANAASGTAADPEETLKVLESRFLIAQMLTAQGDDSTMVRNLDKQIARLTPGILLIAGAAPHSE